MSPTLKRVKDAADTTAAEKPPKDVVRLRRSKKVPVVTPAMRAKAKISKRSAFPELPEWRLER